MIELAAPERREGERSETSRSGGAVNSRRPAAPPAADPEVVAKAQRRKFTAEYKLAIVEEADRATDPGGIGSHWMDMVQHLTGLKITSLCADLQIFHPTRKRPKVAVETFAGKTLRPEDYDEIPIDTEDFGAVLVRLGGRVRGAFTASQVSTGCKNRLQMEIYGTKAGVIWNQERPEELWIGQRNAPNQLMLKDPSLLAEKARSFADLPGGHGEGYGDAHKQVFRRFYQTVADRSAPVDYATFADGLQMMRLLEKVLESHQRRAWVEV